MEKANNAHTFDQGADPALYGQPPHLQGAQPGKELHSLVSICLPTIRMQSNCIVRGQGPWPKPETRSFTNCLTIARASRTTIRFSSI